MIKIHALLLLIIDFALLGQCVEFKELGIKKNNFLGPSITSCSTIQNNSHEHFQKAYDCGNNSVANILHLNFIDPQFLGQQFYIFNNFINSLSFSYDMGQWNGKNAKQAAHQSQAAANPDAIFSGTGVFMVLIGTSPYLQQQVIPTQTCPAGKMLVVAQLKYNNGNSINLWSQDCLCCGMNDQFAIQISSNIDVKISNLGHKSQTDTIDLMQDALPTENYSQATTSPRSIKLVIRS